MYYYFYGGLYLKTSIIITSYTIFIQWFVSYRTYKYIDERDSEASHQAQEQQGGELDLKGFKPDGDVPFHRSKFQTKKLNRHFIDTSHLSLMDNFLWFFFYTNDESMKCCVYKMLCLWNVVSIKYCVYAMLCPWNVMSRKCCVHEICVYEISCICFDGLWNVPTLYRISV